MGGIDESLPFFNPNQHTSGKGKARKEEKTYELHQQLGPSQWFVRFVVIYGIRLGPRIVDEMN